MSLSKHDEEVKRLRDANEVLREELRQLKDAFLGRRLFAPAEWGLSIQQELMAAALAKRGSMTNYQIALAATLPYPQNQEVDIGQIKVQIHHIRRKIKRFGFSITLRWGTGYFVNEAYQAAFQERDV